MVVVVFFRRPDLNTESELSSLLPSVPRSTTPHSLDITPTSPREEDFAKSTTSAAAEDFVQELRDSADSEKALEDTIMGMILRSPSVVADALASMFEHEDEASEERTRAGLEAMIEKDPVGVTVAFSDLVVKQKNMLDDEGGQEDLFTPEVPHKYEDPPEEVQGMLLRLSMDGAQVREGN